MTIEDKNLWKEVAFSVLRMLGLLMTYIITLVVGVVAFTSDRGDLCSFLRIAAVFAVGVCIMYAIDDHGPSIHAEEK